MTTYRLTFRCPDLHSQEDAEILREHLVHVAGVGEVNVDYRTKLVEVVTSNQDGGRSIREVILKSDYPPED